ncbi:MAG: right-handed parallel beta-helix repeat-containing protein [Pseudonocardiaceae bacterium]
MIGARLRWLCATLIGLVLMTGGCTTTPGPASPGAEPPYSAPSSGGPDSAGPDSAGPPSAGAHTSGAGPLPAECTDRLTEPDQASAALGRAQPGSLVCLTGAGLAGAELQVTTSGTPQQPIRIVSDGATMRSLNVKADYIVIQGLILRDGDGLTMTGRGLVARNNVIDNATANGVECKDCVDTIIESNTVQHADGTGIWLSGERITVRNNTVSDSVLRTMNDADGIRFFGRGHRLTGNTIKDISAAGYPHGGPHTDCFQTYDSRDTPPTYDVVISDNICTNVDVQALIATIDDPRGAPPEGPTTITFERNTVQVNGSQAVLLRHFPHVIIRDNHFSGPGDRAVNITEGSTDCTVTGNTVSGNLRPFEIDRQSQRGFQESGNSR